jgi:hypothetical protein
VCLDVGEENWEFRDAGNNDTNVCLHDATVGMISAMILGWQVIHAGQVVEERYERELGIDGLNL